MKVKNTNIQEYVFCACETNFSWVYVEWEESECVLE